MFNLLARIKNSNPLKLIWWCLALSILSSTIARYTADSSGFIHYVMVVIGSGGCAWFWLLSRTLFHKNHVLISKKTLVVPMIIVIEGIEALWSPVGVNEVTNELFRVFNNVATIVCITAIVFVWHETLNGFNKIRSINERRFRMVFLGVFSLPVFIAVLWVMGAEAGTFAGDRYDALLTFCAIISLVGSRLAIEYRLKMSTDKSSHFKNTLDIKNDEQTTKLLAHNILEAIRDDSFLTQPNAKVATLADYIGVQEYKVTRCITGHLHYRNFNHLLNNHRIDRAIQIFKDANSQHLNIATIAYDCGFNSLGPFNRAFKQHTGMTPRVFRQQLYPNP